MSARPRPALYCGNAEVEPHMTRILLILTLVAAAPWLTACGNKGPLFLPEEPNDGAAESANG